MSVVSESAPKAPKGRITYGITIHVGNYEFNEWGLPESQAKEVSEMLTANNEQPITVEGIKFGRRAPSELSKALAAAKAKLVPAQV